MVIVTSLMNSQKLARKIAKSIRAKYIETDVEEFPDGEIYLRFKSDVIGEKLVIIESFQPNPNESLLRIIFASRSAKMQGAKKVILVAPYLGFMRQDKEFDSGDAINALIMSDLMNLYLDKVLTIDPHLHRIHKMKDVFKIPAKNLTANSVIAKHIKKNFSKRDLVIVGPDEESFQWADKIAKEVHVKDTVMHKDRYTTRRVDVKMTDEIDFKGKNVIIVDDIISTGNTMIKSAIKIRKLGAKSVFAIGVHALFIENGFKKMRKHFDGIYTTNSVQHETNLIDVSSVITEELKKRA